MTEQQPTAPRPGAERHGEPGIPASTEEVPARGHEAFHVAGLVDEPAKVMRIGGMIKQLLDEVKAAPIDEEARGLLADIHERSVQELETGLSPELAAELHRIRLPFQNGETPSESELRIAQAQLVGWLEGVFHGIQTALAAQQLANQQLAQRIQMKQLPPGTQVAPGIVINEQGEPVRMSAEQATQARGADPSDHDGGPGQYL